MGESLAELVFAPQRQRILRIIWSAPKSAGQISNSIPEVTFGAISQHLTKLRKAGVVTVDRTGRSRIYSVNRPALGPLAIALEAMWDESLSRLKLEAESQRTSRRDQDE